MVITLLSWIYIFAVSLIVGMAFNKALSKVIPVPSCGDNGHFGITGLVATDLVSLTVYAEFFSIFYKVGAVCHLVMLFITCISGYILKKRFCVSL